MAKKSPQKIKAFEFVFDGAQLQAYLNQNNPKKVLFTVSIATKVTKDNKKVGALEIGALCLPRKTGASKGDGLDGCPIPPCTR